MEQGMSNINACPCNSGRPHFSCCEPIISGKMAAVTAEALMRSRYTAYVVKNMDYLLKTWHPSTRPANIDFSTIPQWSGLHIIGTVAGNESDSYGMVEFKATSLSPGKIIQLHEKSRFVKEHDQWFYVDGDIMGNKLPNAQIKKVGRNQPCPCGSGKKFKKCCGS
jgi:SEC-C motif-containing protein